MIPPHLRQPWIAAAVFVLGICVLSNLAAPPWRLRVVEALRGQGYPMTFAEVAAADPQFTDAENAADRFRQAAEEIRVSRATHDSIWSDLLETALVEGATPAPLKQLVSDNEKVLALAASTRTLPGGRFPLREDNWFMWLDDVSDPVLAERLGKLLRIAAVVHAQAGEMGRATRMIETMHMLATSLENAGHAGFRRFAAIQDQRMLDTLRILIEGFPLDGDIRERLVAVLQSRDTDPERWAFSDVVASAPGVLFTLQQPYFAFTPRRHAQRNMHIGWPQEMVLRAAGYGQFGSLLLAQSIDDADNFKTKSPFKLQDAIDQSLQEQTPLIPMRGGTQTAHIIYSYWESYQYAAQRAQLAGGLRLALAVAAYRDAHGRLPEGSEDLVPVFLDAVPMDYCAFLRSRYVSKSDRERLTVDPFPPLRYTPEAEGYRIHANCEAGDVSLTPQRLKQIDESGARLNLRVPQ